MPAVWCPVTERKMRVHSYIKLCQQSGALSWRRRCPLHAWVGQGAHCKFLAPGTPGAGNLGNAKQGDTGLHICGSKIQVGARCIVHGCSVVNGAINAQQ
eukprot:268984-Pelagomonas_calceolata.AAC.6